MFRNRETPLLYSSGDHLQKALRRWRAASSEAVDKNEVYSEIHDGLVRARFEDRREHPLSMKGEKE